MKHLEKKGYVQSYKEKSGGRGGPSKVYALSRPLERNVDHSQAVEPQAPYEASIDHSEEVIEEVRGKETNLYTNSPQGASFAGLAPFRIEGQDVEKVPDPSFSLFVVELVVGKRATPSLSAPCSLSKFICLGIELGASRSTTAHKTKTRNAYQAASKTTETRNPTHERGGERSRKKAPTSENLRRRSPGQAPTRDKKHQKPTVGKQANRRRPDTQREKLEKTTKKPLTPNGRPNKDRRPKQARPQSPRPEKAKNARPKAQKQPVQHELRFTMPQATTITVQEWEMRYFKALMNDYRTLKKELNLTMLSVDYDYEAKEWKVLDLDSNTTVVRLKLTQLSVEECQQRLREALHALATKDKRGGEP
ncbi:MAG: hypothetical protein NZM36_04530 [Aquificaceae bacterium]|nr:hypothetical protein [Aquificaceae bacterium]